MYAGKNIFENERVVKTEWITMSYLVEGQRQ